MKQVLQNLRTGEITLEEVPSPGLGHNNLLIRSRASLISAGTERQLIEFGKGSLLSKARSEPDRVKQVLDKIKTDGLLPTLDTVFKRLDEPLPLGYCNAGVVLGVGSGVTGFKPGDRVISNGPHAEIVSVPKNLCARIPDNVTDEHAAFTVLSSIGLQGIRLLRPTLGEKFVVYGLGLIGLASVQILTANGCDVMGIDINPERLKLAEKYGARVTRPEADPLTAVQAWSEDKGVDGVLITVSAKKDDVVHRSAQMCRKRGRMVLVGVVNMNLLRSDFYTKELSFQVSCSYGPGRYDDEYEQGGRDYPFGFVRWTEQRNFQTILNMMSTDRLSVDTLITHRYPHSSAKEAYNTILDSLDSLGVIFEYPEDSSPSSTISVSRQTITTVDKPVIGVIGAGNFSKMTVMPTLKKLKATVAHVADLNGASAQHLASKFDVQYATSDHTEILKNDSVNAVFIILRHNLHAAFVVEALEAGKHVFVEKPLALTREELNRVIETVNKRPEQMIMVGFNRRFSPHTVKVRELLSSRIEPLCVQVLVNSGRIPSDSWVQNKEVGGGRIVGEACHFIDLLVSLIGSKVKTIAATMMGGSVTNPEDRMSMTLSFEDGSVGSINYFSNGPRNYPKEQIKVFSEGRVLEIENFRLTRGYGFSGFKKFKTTRQDKGHESEFAAFIERISSGGEPPVPVDELINVTLSTFAAMRSAEEERTVRISENDY